MSQAGRGAVPGYHGEQGLGHQGDEGEVDGDEADDPGHGQEVDDPRCVVSTEQGGERRELDRFPDGEAGQHGADAEKQDDDVEKLLNGIVDAGLDVPGGISARR